jgi:hypothetical protein
MINVVPFQDMQDMNGPAKHIFSATSIHAPFLICIKRRVKMMFKVKELELILCVSLID